jgi:hypothetical protein
VAYQLFAGTTPFRSPSSYLTFQRVLAHDVEAPVANSGAGACATHEPEARLDSAATLLALAQDGLLFPPAFPPVARDFVLRLLRRQPSNRLGAAGAGESAPIAGCDRQLGGGTGGEAEAAVAATAITAPVPMAPASGVAARGRSAPGRRVRPEDTVPRVLPRIDFGAIRAHPLLAGAMADTECTELATLGARAPQTAPVVVPPLELTALLAVARQLAAPPLASGGLKAAAWDRLVAGLACLSPALRAQLQHLMAMRRRLQAPAVWQALAQPLHGVEPAAAARCLRPLLTTGLRAATGAGQLTLEPLRLGDFSPREIVAWNVAPQAYVTRLERWARRTWFHANSNAEPPAASGDGSEMAGCEGEVESSSAGGTGPAGPSPAARAAELDVNVLGWRAVSGMDFHAPFYLVAMADPRIDARTEEEADASPAVASLRLAITAVNRLTPAPRAVVVLGQLTACGLTGSATEEVEAVACAQMVQLVRCFASLAHASTSVLLAGAECVSSAAAIQAGAPAAGCGAGTEWPTPTPGPSMLAQLRQLDTCTAAWLTGVRAFLVHPDALVSTTHARGEDLPRRPSDWPSPEEAAAHTAWLREALDIARPSSQHSVLVARAPATAADVWPTVAGLLADTNVRLVLEPGPVSGDGEGGKLGCTAPSAQAVLVSQHNLPRAPSATAADPGGSDGPEHDANASHVTSVAVAQVLPLAACTAPLAEATAASVRLCVVRVFGDRVLAGTQAVPMPATGSIARDGGCGVGASPGAGAVCKPVGAVDGSSASGTGSDSGSSDCHTSTTASAGSCTVVVDLQQPEA